MKCTAAVLALALAQTTAFMPMAGRPMGRAVRLNAEVAGDDMGALNGWVPDENAFAWGLPGNIAPVGDFDPAGFATACSLPEMKRYREAEVTHGRVAMLSVIGFLVAESFHPLFGGEIIGPAIDHLTEVRKIQPEFFELLALSIGIVETSRAQNGWVPPDEVEGKQFLNDDYYPGDINFDPLGLKPTNAAEFAEMQTKELQHGRLAMLASMGFIAQELVNHAGIIENLQ
jgi:hypothetical protein